MERVDELIADRIKKIRGRIRAGVVWNRFLWGLAAGFAGALVLSLLTLVFPLYRMPYFIAVWVSVCILGGIIRGIRKTPSMEQAALMADAKGYKERLSTAWFLRGREDPFASLQKQDALNATEGMNIRKAFPLRVSVKAVSLVLVAGILFVGSLFLDSPARREAENKKELAEEIKEELAKLEEVKKELEQAGNIGDISDGALMDILEKTRLEISEADSLAALQKIEERFAQKLEDESKKTDAEGLKSELEKLAANYRGESAAKQEQIAQAAKEAMEQAGNGSDLDKAQAAERLKELAESTGDEGLKAAAAAYENSNYSNAAYNAAQAALDNTTQQMANASTSQNGNQNPNGSQNPNGNQDPNGGQNQNGNQDPNGNQNGSQNGQGQGQGQGEGQGQGQGEGQGQGQGNQGQGNGGQGTNGQSGQGGGGWNYGGTEGHEGPANVNESITVPAGTLGDDGNLTGVSNEAGSSTVTSSSDGQTWAGSKISYEQVSGEYKDKAYQQIDRSDYPTGMKNKIKEYFDGLQ